MRSHKLTNVAVLACAMLLAGASTAVLGLAMRFSVVSLTLISVCLMAPRASRPRWCSTGAD